MGLSIFSNPHHNYPSPINSICSKCHCKPKLITNINTCKENMTWKGAARDLTVDLDLVMLDANSSSQGQKMNGGNKTASEEKRSRATSAEKKNKPKKKSPPTPLFWLGFDAMEELALEDGTPHNLEPTPTLHTTKKCRSDKEATKLFTAVYSYPHVNQTLFPLTRHDNIEGQYFNITQLPFEV